MNRQVQTTTPNKPTAIPPPEVPLGIQGTFTPVPGIQPLEGKMLQRRLDNLIYLEQDDINVSHDTGTVILNFDTQTGIPTTSYVTELTQGTQVLVPWSLINAYYSRMCKIDYELIIQPIKVPDCRVSMDFVHNYNGKQAAYDNKTLVNHNVHYLFDSPQSALELSIPMFWPVMNVNTNQYIHFAGTAGYSTYKNAFIPQTKTTGYIAAPYVRINLQPTHVSLVVWLKLIPRQVQGAAAMKTKTILRDKVTKLRTTFLPLPYFYTDPVIYT